MSGTASPWASVLFDLDGTLADTVELILRCYRHTMATHLGSPRPDEDWLRTIGRPLRDSLAEFARNGEEASAMLETYVAFQRDIHDDLVRPYDGIVEVVALAGRTGARVGVVTSKRREMALRTLGCCGLDDDVEVLVAADDVEKGKPDPEPVSLALEQLGLAPGPDVLFVGDSPFDLQAGRAAGVRTAAVLWGPFARDVLEAEGPDYVAEDVPALARIVRGSGRGGL